MRNWLLGRKCPTCLHRSWGSCGALSSERQVFPDGGWVWWRSFNPCSVVAPRGVNPDLSRLDPDGGIEDMRDIYAQIAENGGSYGDPAELLARAVYAEPDPED